MDGISRRGFIGGISSLGAVVAHGDANPPNATNGATVADAQKSVSRAGPLVRFGGRPYVLNP